MARRAATSVTFGILAVVWASQITESQAERDDLQNVTMAVHLSHDGVIKERARGGPSMRREPLPVLATSISVAVADAIMGTAPADEYLSGPRIRILKYQNLLWMGLLSVAVLFSVIILTGSHSLALVAVALTSVTVPLVPYSGLGPGGLGLDTLYTELPAAALLTSAGLMLGLGVLRGSRRLVVASGLAFGLLALVKAAFLYVFLGLAATLPIARMLLARGKWREALIEAGVLTVAFAVVVLPWMYRNERHFGQFQITERGGNVLYTRAVKNTMTAAEYRASFHYWTPQGPLRAALRRGLGIRSADYELGGAYARLNRGRNSDFWEADLAAERAGQPEATISYWRTARAEHMRLTNQLRSEGIENPRAEADQLLKETALQMIRAEPGRHLLMTVPFLWRGAFIPFPLLLLGLGFALRSRKAHLVAYVLPAFGAVMFYALLSHYRPRYSAPMVPISMVTALVMASAAWQALIRRVRPQEAQQLGAPSSEGGPVVQALHRPAAAHRAVGHSLIGKEDREAPAAGRPIDGPAQWPDESKLVIQIPCLNEESTLPQTIADLPRSVPGFAKVEFLVVDDGSTDRTVEVARELGVDHIVQLGTHRGLATAFSAGLRHALAVGADVVVNTDGDNQYCGDDVPKLLTPIVEGRADLVVGCRPVLDHEEFGPVKKALQVFGSWVLRRVSRTDVRDAASGFRAMSRKACTRLFVHSRFSYCMETLIQAGNSGLRVEGVDIRVNRSTRESRLFHSIPHYVRQQAATIMAMALLYRPFAFFVTLASPLFLVATALGIRYMYLKWYIYPDDPTRTFIASLVLVAVLAVLGSSLVLAGLVSSSFAAQRRLIEAVLTNQLEVATVAGPTAESGNVERLGPTRLGAAEPRATRSS